MTTASRVPAAPAAWTTLLSAGLMVSLSAAAAAQCPAPGSCIVPHPTPGCDNAACCQQVCVLAPNCCEVAWDDFCAKLAGEICTGICGAPGLGDCFSAHPEAGCSDPECCEMVCAADPFCCSTMWDSNCAVLATFMCPGTPGICGDPQAGSCFQTHPNGACSDAGCCMAVCSVDPGCCDSAWDFICVGIADSVCEPCMVDCPEGGIFETENCGTRTNDPCIFPTAGAAPQALLCGQTVCGRVFDDSAQGPDPDVDVYAITLTDLDGDGLAKVRLSFSAEFQGFAALMPAPCGDLADSPLVATSIQCIIGIEEACVAPGPWRIVVSTGLFPNPGEGVDDVSCGDNGRYVLKAECLDDCGPPCGPGAGDCFLSHANPGCDDVDCCEMVCAVSAYCCLSTWDGLCAAQAFDLCGGEPPANDTCAACLPAATGETLFSTIGAATGGPPLPATCDEGFGLSFDQDVWFCWQARCDGEAVAETCGNADFDTRIAVYSGECGNLTLEGCSDDGQCLVPSRSRAVFATECGTTYFIRIGGFEGAFGTGTLSVSCSFGFPCPTACPEDLTGDGAVDGADLGTLLSAWGGAGLGDLDGSGEVDGGDLGLLLSAWGDC